MSEMVQHKNILQRNTNRRSNTRWPVVSSCIELKDFTCSQAVTYTAKAVMYGGPYGTVRVKINYLWPRDSYGRPM